jgi:hypothetical protein
MEKTGGHKTTLVVLASTQLFCRRAPDQAGSLGSEIGGSDGGDACWH